MSLAAWPVPVNRVLRATIVLCSSVLPETTSTPPHPVVASFLLNAMVQLMTVSVLKLTMPPESPPLAEFSAMVELLTVIVPPFSMPPARARKLLAMVESLTVTVPEST